MVRGSRWLPPAHLAIRGSIPVTNAARTLFDLAGVDARGRVEQAVDAAIHRRLCTSADIHRVFFAIARRGRRGTTAMRTILEARGQEHIPPASELERRARRLFAEAGLPSPEFEVDLGDEGWIGRVDCLWREAKVIVELDGRRFHGGAIAHDADRRRDNRLMAAGWRVIRLTWDDICHHPERSVRLVQAALNPRPA